MSIEEVERILDETQESIEYQRVNAFIFDTFKLKKFKYFWPNNINLTAKITPKSFPAANRWTVGGFIDSGGWRCGFSRVGSYHSREF